MICYGAGLPSESKVISESQQAFTLQLTDMMGMGDTLLCVSEHWHDILRNMKPSQLNDVGEEGKALAT